MQRPSLLPSSPSGENFGGYSYHLDGSLVPTLTIDLSQDRSVYFEHHILLWKSTNVKINIKKLKGVVKRLFSGMPIFMTEAKGEGSISFSRDGVGQIFPIHLKRGQELDVRENQFLAATDTVDYDFEMIKGVSNILFGGTGFFIDRFTATDNDGVIWLYGYGNVFEINLGEGEQIDVEPSAWLYKDPGVKLDTNFTSFSTGIFAGANIALNRFTGPGRLGIQSMSLLSQLVSTVSGTSTGGPLDLVSAAIKLLD